MRMVLAATTRRIVAVFGRDITFREAKVSFGAPNSWQAWEPQVASNSAKKAEGAVRSHAQTLGLSFSPPR